jgi:hypothetical protein
MNLTRAFWFIVAVTMAAALEIDWQSKTAEELTKGLVKICRLELALHLFVAPTIVLLPQARTVPCC